MWGCVPLVGIFRAGRIDGGDAGADEAEGEEEEAGDEEGPGERRVDGVDLHLSLEWISK